MRLVLQSRGQRRRDAPPRSGERARVFKEVPGESTKGKTYTAKLARGTEHSACPAPGPEAPPAQPGFSLLLGGRWGQQGSSAVCLQAPGRTWGSQPPPGRPPLGSGALAPSSGLCPANPSPSSAVATQVAGNRNRGRKKRGGCTK